MLMWLFYRPAPNCVNGYDSAWVTSEKRDIKGGEVALVQLCRGEQMKARIPETTQAS